MSTLFSFTKVSGNSKTGAIPVTMTDQNSCPDSCALKGGACYARFSFVGMQWNRLSNGKLKSALGSSELLEKVKGLPSGQLWRHNVAGDLPHQNGIIDHRFCTNLVQANKRKRGFTYTHHNPFGILNHSIIKFMNDRGFTVNLSANNAKQADDFLALNIAPVVTLLQIGANKVSYTPKGTKVVRCPAEYNDSVTCARCTLCQKHDRKYAIGFTAHGTKKKDASIIASDGGAQ